MLNRLSVITLIIFLLASSFPQPTSAYRRYRRYRRINLSGFIYSRRSDDAPLEEFLHPPSPPTPFLKNVVMAIGKREKWDFEEVKISQMDLKNSRIGAIEKYDFRVGAGDSERVVKLLDQVSPWERLSVHNESDFEALVKEIGSKTVISSLKIEGPFHLTVAQDHNLTLNLPLNTSFAGLKHLLVGEGITVEVYGASEMSLLHENDAQNFVDRKAFEYLSPSLCMRRLPIRILGSATVVAYMTQNPETYIQTLVPSKRTVELLPAKCYSSHVYGKWGSWMDLLKWKIPSLEKVTRNIVGESTNEDQGSVIGSLHAKLIASSVFRFKLELQREFHGSEGRWSTLAEWRTKPASERVWYNVVARADGGVLKPLIISKIKPIDEEDLQDWRNPMANVSFTKFPGLLLPQKSLTLGVKW